MKQPFYDEVETGVLLRVYLTPRAQKERIGEAFTDADGQVYLKAYVCALPEDNEANHALIVLLSKTFKFAKSQIEIVSGHQSRKKKVRIEGKRVAISEKV